MLYVDAATYVVSFLLLAGFVPRTKKLGASIATGVLAGIQFFVRDKLLARLGITVIVLNFLAAGLSAALPYYAYDAFSGSSKVAGLFYTAIGAGALLGSIGAVLVVKRVHPLRLAGVAIVCMCLPLWLLPFDLPAWGVMATLFVALLFAPLVNGPTIGVITARTPVELRPKVMAALISVAALAQPLGFLVAGQLLEPWGVEPRLRSGRDRDDGDRLRLRHDRLPPEPRGDAGGSGRRGVSLRAPAACGRARRRAHSRRTQAGHRGAEPGSPHRR